MLNGVLRLKRKNITIIFSFLLFFTLFFTFVSASSYLISPAMTLSDLENIPIYNSGDEVLKEHPNAVGITVWLKDRCCLASNNMLGYQYTFACLESASIDTCLFLQEHSSLPREWIDEKKCCINWIRSDETNYCWRHETWGSRCHIINTAKAIEALILAGECPGDELWRLNSLQDKTGCWPVAEEWGGCDYKSTVYALKANLLAKYYGCWAKNRDKAIQKAQEWLKNYKGGTGGIAGGSSSGTTTGATRAGSGESTGGSSPGSPQPVPLFTNPLDWFINSFNQLIQQIMSFFRQISGGSPNSLPLQSPSSQGPGGKGQTTSGGGSSKTNSNEKQSPSGTQGSNSNAKSPYSYGVFNIDCCCACEKGYKVISIHGNYCPFKCCMNCYSICDEACNGNPVSYSSCVQNEACWNTCKDMFTEKLGGTCVKEYHGFCAQESLCNRIGYECIHGTECDDTKGWCCCIPHSS